MKFNHNLEILHKKLNSFKFKHIQNSFYFNKYMKIGPVNKQRSLFLYLIKQKEIEKINENYLNLGSALKKLALYTIKSEDSVILQKLHLEDLDLKAIKKRNLKMLFNYARIDSVFNGETFKVVEFNARRPQMYEDTDWISSKIHNHVKNIKKEENIKLIINSIKDQFKLQRKKVKYLILISDFNKQGSFSFNKELKAQFKNAKISQIKFSKVTNFYKKLTLEKDGLYYKNIKIDALVIQSLGKGKKSIFSSQGGINNYKIKKAYLNKQIEISSPPTSMFFGRKQSLHLLQDQYIQKLIKLNKDEIDATRICAFNYPADEIYNLTNFDNYVLKITGVGQGKGVYIGKDINRKIIKETQNYLKQNSSKVILQEKIDLKVEKIFMLKSKKYKNAVIQLEPFIIANSRGKMKISGYSARAILQKNATETTKFNPAFNNSKILFGSVVSYK